MAVLMAGKGFAQPGKSVQHEKVKFTVSVRGRQWSSARYVHETVEEFARVIQRNARRLDFIGENDRIQRLQLARADGSEPEELDVDATLEDVIICMGDKRLVAIIIPSKSPTPSSGGREAEKGQSTTTMAITGQSKSKVQSDGTPKPAIRYGLATSMSVLPVKEIPSGIPGLKPVPVLFKRRVASREPPLRRLQITIPSSDANPPTALHDEKGKLARDVDGEHEALPAQPNPNHFNGAVVSNSNGAVALMSSKSTPSPAELAHFLVKGSCLPSNRSTAVNDTCCNPFCSQYLGNATPAPGFHNFASALLRRLPVIPPSTVVCGGTPADNIASTLAQFLASHLRAAVVPGNKNRVTSCPPASGQPFPLNKIDDSSNAPDRAVPCSNVDPEPDSHCKCHHTREKPLGGSGASSGVMRSNSQYSSSGGGFEIDEASVSGSRDEDKKDPSSPADNTIVASPPTNPSMHGRSELIFFINRRSKTGVGAHHLKLSDLSIYFHLSVVDAAKKLGVSQTTLKKACRKFGLKRWPGRKVRSLESTIHGLEHTIAVGQGAGMEQLTEAYIRSEVKKLQQEMDQLVHGTLAQQQSPATRTGDLYKRLYSRGWRSKYHSPSFDFDLNIDSQDNELVTSSHGKNGHKGIEESGRFEAEHNSRNLGQQILDACGRKENPPDCKLDQKRHVRRDKTMKPGSDNTISLDVGVGIQEFVGDCALGTDGTRNIIGNLIEKLAKDDTSLGVVELLTSQDLFCERSPKRPKLGISSELRS